VEGSCECSNDRLGFVKFWKFSSGCIPGGLSSSVQLSRGELLYHLTPFTYGYMWLDVYILKFYVFHCAGNIFLAIHLSSLCLSHILGHLSSTLSFCFD
jgi:hypothetical protein